MAHDLQLKPNKYLTTEGWRINVRAVELFKTVGCRIVPLSEPEREKRKITKSEAKSFKIAKLRCPPEFPKVRRPKARNSRR
jgi:DNA-directed RNA polymerase I subunit RPA49